MSVYMTMGKNGYKDEIIQMLTIAKPQPQPSLYTLATAVLTIALYVDELLYHRDFFLYISVTGTSFTNMISL